MTDEPARSSGAPYTTGGKNYPFHLMVRESENDVEHLSSRGAPGGIFLSCHSSFDISRVVRTCVSPDVVVVCTGYLGLAIVAVRRMLQPVGTVY